MNDDYAGLSRLYSLVLEPALGALRRRIWTMARHVEAATLLDVGCGPGALCRELTQYKRDELFPVGVDRSAAMLSEARRQSRGAACFVRSEGTALPFADKTFDVAVLSLCLHENEERVRRAMLAEASRAAKRLIVVDYTGKGGPLTWVGRIPERLAGRKHYKAYREFRQRGGVEGVLTRCGVVPAASAQALWGLARCVLTQPT